VRDNRSFEEAWFFSHIQGTITHKTQPTYEVQLVQSVRHRSYSYKKWTFRILVKNLVILVSKRSPVTGLEGPRGFLEVKIPRFRDNGTGWW